MFWLVTLLVLLVLVPGFTVWKKQVWHYSCEGLVGDQRCVRTSAPGRTGLRSK